MRVLDQSDKDVGLTYYLPKAYLVLTKNVAFNQPPAAPPKESEKPAEEKDSAVGSAVALEPTPAPQFTANIIYLPDLCKGPRRIKLDPRLGSIESTFGLANGWQLNAAQVNLNSKAAENLASAASLVGAAAPFAAPAPAATGTNANDLLTSIVNGILALGSSTARIDEKALDVLRSKLAEAADPSPRIWLFEYTFDGTCISLRPVECFNPFDFHSSNCNVPCPTDCQP